MLVVVLITACGPSDEQIANAIEETKAARPIEIEKSGRTHHHILDINGGSLNHRIWKVMFTTLIMATERHILYTNSPVAS
jgi:hypothetical protein